MKMDFTDKKVLVTGGTRGIGLTIAQTFLAANADVIITGRSPERPAETITALDNNFEYLSVDFLDDQSTKNFLEQVGNLKALHVCVNNAGLALHNNFDEASVEDWDRTHKANLRGPFMLTQAAAKHMKKQGYGRIVNITSVWAHNSIKKRAAYAASKFGLRGFTVGAAMELAEYNILVNDVAPGFTKTDMLVEGYSKEKLQELSERVPLKRLGETSDVANAVLFLASDLNNYITGQSLLVDGGFCASGA